MSHNALHKTWEGKIRPKGQLDMGVLHERNRDTETETKRQKERETETETDSETESETERETERRRDRQRQRDTERQMERENAGDGGGAGGGLTRWCLQSWSQSGCRPGNGSRTGTLDAEKWGSALSE
jgi:hypothetical protein